MRGTITRAHLRDAIEAGIEKALITDEPMEDYQAALLRHVAATATVVVRGDFQATLDGQTCGCPLTQAGLVSFDDRGIVHVPPTARGFWGRFDSASYQEDQPQACILEVIG